MKATEIEINDKIDKFFYGGFKKFERREDGVYVWSCGQWNRVRDWQCGNTEMSAFTLKRFAIYFKKSI